MWASRARGRPFTGFGLTRRGAPNGRGTLGGGRALPRSSQAASTQPRRGAPRALAGNPSALAGCPGLLGRGRRAVPELRARVRLLARAHRGQLHGHLGARPRPGLRPLVLLALRGSHPAGDCACAGAAHHPRLQGVRRARCRLVGLGDTDGQHRPRPQRPRRPQAVAASGAGLSAPHARPRCGLVPPASPV